MMVCAKRQPVQRATDGFSFPKNSAVDFQTRASLIDRVMRMRRCKEYVRIRDLKFPEILCAVFPCMQFSWLALTWRRSHERTYTPQSTTHHHSIEKHLVHILLQYLLSTSLTEQENTTPSNMKISNITNIATMKIARLTTTRMKFSRRTRVGMYSFSLVNDAASYMLYKVSTFIHCSYSIETSFRA